VGVTYGHPRKVPYQVGGWVKLGNKLNNEGGKLNNEGNKLNNDGGKLNNGGR